MSRRPVRRPRTARRLPGARRRETSRLTGKTVSRPEFSVSRFGFPVSRPAALRRSSRRCAGHLAGHVSHPGVTSGAPTFVDGHPCGWGGCSAALPVGAPFMTPDAVPAQGVGCISHGGLRVFSGHPGRKRQSSGRHKWRPYVFCAGGCGLRRRVIWPTCGGCSRGRASDNFP